MTIAGSPMPAPRNAAEKIPCPPRRQVPFRFEDRIVTASPHGYGEPEHAAKPIPGPPSQRRRIASRTAVPESRSVWEQSAIPSAAPLLKMPLARLRSDGGKALATIREAHGQLNVSPMPSTPRVIISIGKRKTKAAAPPASDQSPTASPYVIRKANRSAIIPAGSLHQGVGPAKRGQKFAILLVVQSKLRADLLLADGQRLPVEVGKHRGQEKHAGQPPFPGAARSVVSRGRFVLLRRLDFHSALISASK